MKFTHLLPLILIFAAAHAATLPVTTTADAGGGALNLEPTVASTITNCTFSGNAQNGIAAGQPGGGAIYNYGAGLAALGNVSAPAGYSLAGFPAAALANGQSVTFNVTLTAANPGLFDAALTFTGNDAFDPALATAAAGSPNLHQIHLSGLVTDTADHWRRQNFGATATNSGPAADNADPAGDGMVNLL